MVCWKQWAAWYSCSAFTDVWRLSVEFSIISLELCKGIPPYIKQYWLSFSSFLYYSCRTERIGRPSQQAEFGSFFQPVNSLFWRARRLVATSNLLSVRSLYKRLLHRIMTTKMEVRLVRFHRHAGKWQFRENPNNSILLSTSQIIAQPISVLQHGLVPDDFLTYLATLTKPPFQGPPWYAPRLPEAHCVTLTFVYRKIHEIGRSYSISSTDDPKALAVNVILVKDVGPQACVGAAASNEWEAQRLQEWIREEGSVSWQGFFFDGTSFQFGEAQHLMYCFCWKIVATDEDIVLKKQ